MSGLTEFGFERKRLSDIKKEIEDALKDRLGASINLVAPSVFSQVVGIFSEREDLIWQLAENVYNSSYPDTAKGTSLDNVVAISGLSRLAATFSVVPTVYLFGTIGATIPTGTVFSVEGNPDARFETLSDVTLVAGQNEIQLVAFSAVPDAGVFKLSWNGIETVNIPYNALAADVQTALRNLPTLGDVTVSGNFTSGFTINFLGSSGLQPQFLLDVVSSTLMDGLTPVTATETRTQNGAAQGSLSVTAENAGAVQAFARTLTVIETPVSGLDSIINPLDANLGREEETDLELRARQQESFQIAGAATVEAIESRIRNVQGVYSVRVIENDTDSPDIQGRPPHSFEAIVLGGDDAEIAEELWQSKAAGIRTFGTTTVVVIDSQGQPHDVEFSRPTPVPIYIEVDLETDGDYPIGGDDIVKQKLVERGTSAFEGGKNVIPIPTLIGVLDEIPGIIDAEIRVGTAPNPTTDANIPISIGEIATFDTSRVVVGNL